MELPKNILDIIVSNKTSLGDNPALPPETDDKFLVFLVNDYYEYLLNHLNTVDVETLTDELSESMTECKRIENENKEELEKLCFDFVNELFDIPSDTLSIDIQLVDKIDTKQERLIPEATNDYSFDSINDINTLTKEIYKRRFLDSLITGASMYYAEYALAYGKEHSNIDEHLFDEYKKILMINNFLLFHTKQSLGKKQKDGGNVDVYISDEATPVRIEAKGMLFPILVEETIKGILELSISHGLPNEREKAEYVMSKADFKLAEVWDQRLGIPLWERINSLMEECGNEVNINFLLMELSSLKVDDFNEVMQETLAHTKKGKSLMNNLIGSIRRNQDLDDFDDYISNQQINGNDYPLNDEDFTSDDLINDDLCATNIMDEDELL